MESKPSLKKRIPTSKIIYESGGVVWNAERTSGTFIIKIKGKWGVFMARYFRREKTNNSFRHHQNLVHEK